MGCSASTPLAAEAAKDAAAPGPTPQPIAVPSGESKAAGTAATPPPSSSATTKRATTTTTPPSSSSSSKRPPAASPASALLQDEMEFTARYQFVPGKDLGSGNYSVVKLAVDRNTKMKVAVKVISQRKLLKEDMEGLKVEVEVLSKIDHPNVIQLFGWYEGSGNYYLVTELVRGGELFDRIVEKEFYSEHDAKETVASIATVIKYLHDMNIVHRDLKPENILLTDDSEQATIKIADFGFARILTPSASAGLTTACGTPGYVAPEILSGKVYGKSVDVWSLGVITYILLCGYPPFHNHNQTQLFKTIKEGRFQFDSPYWDPISKNAKSFIAGCLVVDARARMTIDDVLQHPWIKQEAERNVIPGVLRELKIFNARRKLRAAIRSAIAANKLMDIAENIKAMQEGHTLAKTTKSNGEAAAGQ